jgi:hypothetical protein
MKNKEVISRLRTTIKEHYRDSILSNKYLYNLLKTSALFIIKREFDTKNNVFMQSSLFSSACIDMVKVSSLSCDIGIETDCKIWRSKNKLPLYAESSGGFIYQSISSMDGSVQFTLSSAYMTGIKEKVKYNKNKYCWIENGYLYSNNAYPNLKIVGLFLESTNNCSRLEDVFPISDYNIHVVIQETLKELGLSKQIPYQTVQDKNSNQ